MLLPFYYPTTFPPSLIYTLPSPDDPSISPLCFVYYSSLTLDASQDSGRLSVPYVMLYYLPITCNAEVKMLYAGAKELMRNTAEVNRIIEIDSAEDLEEIEGKLKEHA
jgi:hypothetical protein